MYTLPIISITWGKCMWKIKAGKKCYKNLGIPDHQIVAFNLLYKAPKGPYYRCEATLIFHSY